jgi:hypothetical protein
VGHKGDEGENDKGAGADGIFFQGHLYHLFTPLMIMMAWTMDCQSLPV